MTMKREKERAQELTKEEKKRSSEQHSSTDTELGPLAPPFAGSCSKSSESEVLSGRPV